MMIKGYRYFIILMFVFLACDGEEDFYTSIKVDTSVTTEDIKGSWRLYAGEFEGNIIEISPSYPQCGYDYINFSGDEIYQEFLYNKTYCVPYIGSGNWKVENGIIKVSNINGEKIEFPIIEFKPSELVLNFQYDIDDDGKKEIFKAYLRPYEPDSNQQQLISFEQDSKETALLKFNWRQERDVNSFSSYQIYRSQEGMCSKEGAILLASISDAFTTTFVDENPPATQGDLCYFLKVNYKDGLVYESDLLSVNPKELIITNSINLSTPKIEGDDILLEWGQADIPYFSHYQIVYANSKGNNSLLHEEDSILSINVLEETRFLNTDPPYLENPFFAIHVYNIFGTKVASNYEQVTYRRKDLLGPLTLHQTEVDDEEPFVYLYADSQIPDWTSGYDRDAILKFNYNEGLVETTTSSTLSEEGKFPFTKPISFSEEKEMIINGGSNIYFLDPVSFTVNSSFRRFYLNEEFDLFSIKDLTYTRNGFLVVIDSGSINVFKRNGEGLVLLDKQVHYEKHHPYSYYRMIQVNGNDIIVGHKDDEESIFFTVDDSGLLLNKQVVSLPMSSNYTAKFKNSSFCSESNNSLINYGDRIMYSTLSFQVKVRMPENFFALGLDKNANYIYASTNNPDWLGSDVKSSLLKREVLLFNTKTSQVQSIKTKGYPIRVFENNIGEIFSISIPENQSTTFKYDIFIEKIND